MRVEYSHLRLYKRSCDMSLALGGDSMHPGLVEMSVAARMVDLERERQHNRLLAQVPKSRHILRFVASIGVQIVALGTWMQQAEPISA